MEINLLYCIYGMCIMYYSLMAWFFVRKDSRILSRLIVILTLVLALQCIKDLFFIHDFFNHSRHLWAAVTSFDMIAVPLYGAILSALCDPQKFKAANVVVDEIPFVVLPTLFIITGHRIFYTICVIWAALYGLYYVVWTLWTIPHYHRQLREKFSYSENINLNWLRIILLSFFVCLGLYVVDSSISNIILECIYMFGSLVLWMFICFFLYKHESVILELSDTEPGGLEPKGPESIDELTARIERLFAVDKIYLNPTLKLSDVASLAATNRTYVSQFFNRNKDTTFYGYVNRFRVEHACRLLLDTDCTIEVIAEKSGFNSKGTFYRVFSDAMGCSPSKFRYSNQVL